MLPIRACAVTTVSAANNRVAWVVARTSAYDISLYETRDGGHTWRRVALMR